MRKMRARAMALSLATLVSSVLVVCHASVVGKSTVPAMFWSNQHILNGKNEYLVHADKSLTQLDVIAFVRRNFLNVSLALSEDVSVLDRLASSTSRKPKYIIGLFYDQLHATDISKAVNAYDNVVSGGSLSNLYTLISKAISSAILPYVDVEASNQNMEEFLWIGSGKEKEMVTVISESSDLLQLQNLDNADQVQRVIIINLSLNHKSDDELIQKVFEHAETQSDNSYLAVLMGRASSDFVQDNVAVADDGFDYESLFSNPEKRELQAVPVLFASTVLIRSSPAVIMGFLFTLLLLLITCCGFCCMHQIQSPTLYVKSYPRLGKVLNFD